MDALFIEIADYVFDTPINKKNNGLAFKTAYLALLDSLACATLALHVPACTALLGPTVPGGTVPFGARVPGTNFELDPIKAAFDIGTCIRWLDYNDTWLAREWGHPSDNLGAILAVGDFVNRQIPKNSEKLEKITINDVLEAMIKAYEIQGILALENAFNQVGLDHVILVKIASAAVISKWMGFSKAQTCDVLSQVFLDGHSLRTYRHAPNTGPRKSWAAGDACSRAVFLTWLVKQGQTGYPTALSAKRWGFSDVLFQGRTVTLARPLGSYVMENILFKVAYPAEFHAQTAVEAAFHLHPIILQRLGKLDLDKLDLDTLDAIDRIEINTHISAMRIIDKIGPLHNYADRDHCLQYMVAVGLLYGDLKAEHYSNEMAKDPRIDVLRNKMKVAENVQFSKDYLDPDKRSIANSVQIFFKDGSATDIITREYPLGHQRRRSEALPHLQKKYEHAIASYYSGEQKEALLGLWHTEDQVIGLSVSEFINKFLKET